LRDLVNRIDPILFGRRFEKTNEIMAVPQLLDHLADAGQLEGAPLNRSI
jgi:hypothetical protein